MTTQYKRTEEVPTESICKRLEELSHAVTKGQMNEFSMRVPAELDRDADLVLSIAAKRIMGLTALCESQRKQILDLTQKGLEIERMSVHLAQKNLEIDREARIQAALEAMQFIDPITQIHAKKYFGIKEDV